MNTFKKGVIALIAVLVFLSGGLVAQKTTINNPDLHNVTIVTYKGGGGDGKVGGRYVNADVSIIQDGKIIAQASAKDFDYENGIKTVFKLAYGNYKAEVKAEGFVTGLMDFMVESDDYISIPLEPVNRTMYFEPEFNDGYMTLTGNVNDELHVPAKGVTLKLTVNDDVFTTTTDKEGQFKILVPNKSAVTGDQMYFEVEKPFTFFSENQPIERMFIENHFDGYDAITVINPARVRKSNYISMLEKSLQAAFLVPTGNSCTTPTYIVVGKNCSCHSCSARESVLFTDYVKRTVAKEWYANAWGSPGTGTYSFVPTSVSETFKAAAVAIKSYALWFYYNYNQGTGTGLPFNICNSTCCQVYSATVNIPPSVENAVNAVWNYTLVYGNDNVAKAEYSAKTNDMNGSGGCSNGKFGLSVIGGGNVSGGGCFPLAGTDPIEVGWATFGHTRGMSQWGSLAYGTGKKHTTSGLPQNQANGQSLKNWQQMLAHYYPYYWLKNCSTGTITDQSCGNTNCTLSCVATNITCAGNTTTLTSQSMVSGTAKISRYNTQPTWIDWGKERIYKYVKNSSTGNLVASVSGVSAGADLDVFILRNASNTACSALNPMIHAVGTVGSTSTTVTNAPAGTYYIVVDGANYKAVSATFTLTVQGSCQVLSPENEITKDDSFSGDKLYEIDPITVTSFGDKARIESIIPYRFQVTNLNGVVISSGEQSGNYDIEFQDSGMYFVTLISDLGIATTKVAIVK